MIIPDFRNCKEYLFEGWKFSFYPLRGPMVFVSRAEAKGGYVFPIDHNVVCWGKKDIPESVKDYIQAIIDKDWAETQIRWAPIFNNSLGHDW